jgi:hypothetical protein
LFQTSARISKGSSGGALFDAHGNLLGITKFMLKDAQNLNFAIAAERVRKVDPFARADWHRRCLGAFDLAAWSTTKATRKSPARPTAAFASTL